MQRLFLLVMFKYTMCSVYLHVILFILLTFSKCSKSALSDLDRKPQRTDEDSNTINESNKPELKTVLQNNSLLNQSDFKDTAPVWPSKVNSTTVMEGFTIFVGLSIVIVLYFTIKAIRLRRRRHRVRKYGLLTSREDVEMTPLGEEEDDDDSTVFDINDHSRPPRP